MHFLVSSTGKAQKNSDSVEHACHSIKVSNAALQQKDTGPLKESRPGKEIRKVVWPGREDVLTM